MRRLQHTTAMAFRLFSALLTLLFVACGAEDSPGDEGASLYNMNYRISNISTEVPTGNLRAALIWIYNLDDGGIAGISRDVSISSEFPSSFRLAISELPPIQTMRPVESYESVEGDYDCGGMPDPQMYTEAEIEQIIAEEGLVPCPEASDVFSGVNFVVGRLVVYSDRNNNGKLDTLGAEANLEDIVDQIVGPAERVIVMYVEGNPGGTALARDFGVTAGFNLLLGNENDEYSTVDINAELPITLTVNEDMQSLMCAAPIEGPKDSSTSMLSTFIDSLDDAPADTTLSCSTDGLTATFSKSTITEDTLCTSYSKEGEEWILSLDSSAQAPAQWPCTISE